MKKMKWAFFGLTILALILVTLSCAINPVSGKRELMLFSEKQEIAMGQETDQQIRQQFGIYESKGLQDYISGVGQKIVPYSHRPNLTYHFAVLDTPVVNAFAAPGGYIYVTRGILALMGSEAELAVVLGHEMGHVAARHSMKQLSGQVLAQVGLVVGSILSKDIRKLAGLAGIGMQLLFLKFSRSDEYQADSLGIDYARKAQYAPGEMLRFFTALENMVADSGGQSIPTFLSTHPMTNDRIAKVKELISSQDVRLGVKKEPYLSKIDGMIYGENPRQGFSENGVFYHPELAFKFTIPDGWAVENTPKQVVIGEKESKAALVLQAVSSAQDLDTYLQTKVKDFSQHELLRQSSETVNGFQSRHAYFRVPQEQGEPLAVRLTCIRKDKMIYTFVAMSAASAANIFQPLLDRAILSFQRLEDPAYLNRRPSHLSLIRADGSRTLQGIFGAAGVDRKIWKQLGVFNAIGLESVPDPRQLIKLVK
jgi:predicted Zn-dependent protease